MPPRAVPEKFRVAFSYAGEQRDLVRSIAEELEQRLGESTVFFAPWFEHYTAGQDADITLQEIYEHDSDLVVVCVSGEYGSKSWTRVEHEVIRARFARLRTNDDSAERHRVLPIRVGDGDVRGIPDNAIVPDVRNSATKAVELIIGRLALVPGSARPQQEGLTGPQWPATPSVFHHKLADRTEREWPAIQQLMTAASSKRVLFAAGPVGYGTSAILREGEDYARTLGIPTALVDFRRSDLLVDDNAVRELRGRLGRWFGGFREASGSDKWAFLETLRAQSKPILILLDNYERVAEPGLRDWIESSLLEEARDNPGLRFIVAGQPVPENVGPHAEYVQIGPIHDHLIWQRWIHKVNPDVHEKHIEGIVLAFEGVPATVSSTLLGLAKKLIRPASA